MSKYIFHEDPGHGWLEVPVAELVKLGIEGDISGYSYRSGDKAFLEEDCDLSRFAMALGGVEALRALEIKDVYYHGDAPMRAMPSFYSNE